MENVSVCVGTLRMLASCSELNDKLKSRAKRADTTISYLCRHWNVKSFGYCHEHIMSKIQIVSSDTTRQILSFQISGINYPICVFDQRILLGTTECRREEVFQVFFTWQRLGSVCASFLVIISLQFLLICLKISHRKAISVMTLVEFEILKNKRQPRYQAGRGERVLERGWTREVCIGQSVCTAEGYLEFKGHEKSISNPSE